MLQAIYERSHVCVAIFPEEHTVGILRFVVDELADINITIDIL
jgi:hypothetical protein